MRGPSLLAALVVFSLPLIAQAGAISAKANNAEATGTTVANSAETANTSTAQSGSGTQASPDGGTNGNTASNTAGTGPAVTTPNGATIPSQTTQDPTNTARTLPVSDPSANQQQNPQLAQTKEQAWNLINSGDKGAAQAFIKEALKQNPDDADLQALARLGERHDISLDQKALAQKMAALGGLPQTGALGAAAGQERQQKPILASALGFLGAGASRSWRRRRRRGSRGRCRRAPSSRCG